MRELDREPIEFGEGVCQDISRLMLGPTECSLNDVVSFRHKAAASKESFAFSLIALPP